MHKRRPFWVAVVWVATTVAATWWVSAQTEEVSFGNALLVGIVLATVFSVVVARLKRG